ncbi:MAG TPA: hypothetical protein VHF90_05565 [Thermoleophilaceae bacterium]|nr:hypothetical protein [Thermoleophilaceae bacterium]
MGLRRSINGGLAGGVAAALWAAQQPLDKRAFGSGYDDVELVGKALAKGDDWPAAGLAVHVANGVAFGAAYAQLRRFLPGPAVAQGTGLAVAEHFALWPLVAVVDRYHPRRAELAALKGNRAAFWQGLYRHVLFGLVMSSLEARLNADPVEDEPAPVPVSSNGHGDIKLAAATAS